VTTRRQAAGLSPSPQPKPKPSPKSKPAPNAFRKSLLLYVFFLGLAAALNGIVYLLAPPVPEGTCAGVSIRSLFNREEIVNLWFCAKAYQDRNWWYVMGMFELLYLTIKSFGIPATFSLCVLSGALFPLGLSQTLLGLGEGLGSSLCYLLSSKVAGPIVEGIFPDKMAMLRRRTEQEKSHMMLFCFFLRLTPFLPNWFINLAAPLVGVPLFDFFVGSLIGTQGSLLFLSLTGSTLRDVGEKGWTLDSDFKRNATLLAVTMGFLQFVPLIIIGLQKRKGGEADGVASPPGKKAS